MKKLQNKKGFTLIEIVIVIVIIAILAAILVPSMLKWIDKSKKATVTSEADTVRGAVQSRMVEMFKDDVNINGTQSSAAFDDDFWDYISESVNKTIQCSDDTADGYVTFKVENQKITEFTYSADGLTAKSENGEAWIVS